MEPRKEETSVADCLLQDMEAMELDLARRIARKTQAQSSPTKFALEKKNDAFYLNGDASDTEKVWNPISEEKIRSLFDKVDMQRSTLSLNKDSEKREEKRSFQLPDGLLEKGFNGLGNNTCRNREMEKTANFEDSLGLLMEDESKKGDLEVNPEIFLRYWVFQSAFVIISQTDAQKLKVQISKSFCQCSIDSTLKNNHTYFF